MVEHSALYDLSLINSRSRWTRLEIGVSGQPSQASSRLPSNTADQSNNWLTKPWTVLRPVKAKGLAEHVHCTMTASKSHLVRLQLAGTKGTWQGRAAAVTATLQMSWDMTMFLEKRTWTVRRFVHQSGGDTRPIPNYPCWKSGKSTPSLNKRTLLSYINTNSLTPTRPRPPLDPKNHIFTSLRLLHYSLQLITYILTLYCVITDFLIGVHLAGTTLVPPPPHALLPRGFQTYFFPKVSGTLLFHQTVSGLLLYTRARGAHVGSRAKSYSNSLALEGGPLSSKTVLALTSKSSSTFPTNTFHFPVPCDTKNMS